MPETKPRKVFAVVDGLVTGIIGFESWDAAQKWANDNQESGEALQLQVQTIDVYPDAASAPKRPEFF